MTLVLKRLHLRSQLSLEFLLLLAAYLAFLAVLVSSSKGGFLKSVSAGKEVSAKATLEGACFFIDFFSLDGTHSLFEKNFGGFSSRGKTLYYSNRSTECLSAFRFENGLKVQTQETESR